MNFLDRGDLWTTLKSTKKHVVLYGMGNGADKIWSICDRYGIPVSDVFASDGFVRGQSFHQKTVQSYAQLKERYGADGMIVLLSFGSSLPSVLEQIDRIDAECELYAPDVPVCGDNLFNREFYRTHLDRISQARELWLDEESRRIFDHVLAYKLFGRIADLKAAESSKDAVYRELLNAESIRSAADLGAYNGDTVRELLKYAPHLGEVFAMEPDRRNFKKLEQYASSTASPKVCAFPYAAWSEDTTLTFSDSGNRNAGAFAPGGRTVEVEARSLDALLNGASVDYIKYDVEGAEEAALLGSVQTIRTHRPRLLISAYHRSEDLFALPLLVHRLFPDYRLYLRRYPYVPAWDLNLIALPNS